jgi:hypothetical protein
MAQVSSRDFGFWRSFGRLRMAQVLGSWDFLVALALSVGATVLMAHHVRSIETHLSVTSDLLMVAAGLIGVVLAGFAIVAALLGDRYSRVLSASGSSTLNILQHFLIVAGLLTWSIIAAIGFRAFGLALQRWEPVAEQAAFGLVLFSFLWTLFSTLELVKLILGVSVTSTEASLRAISAEDQRQQATGSKQKTS